MIADKVGFRLNGLVIKVDTDTDGAWLQVEPSAPF